MGSLAIKTHSYNKKLLTKKLTKLSPHMKGLKLHLFVCYSSLRYLSLQVQLSNQRL